MSLNTFNSTADADIKIVISGSGQFAPFSTQTYKINWTLDGEVNGETFTDNRTDKEKTCGLPFDSEKTAVVFSAPGSTGNTSGAITTGRIPRIFSSETVGGVSNGLWYVNTSPVLTERGKANGVLSESSNYTVALPEGQTIDDPIVISPAIDYISRVYPGDKVYTQSYTEGDGTKGARWFVAQQERFALPDRTFFWEANTSPKLESGGLSNGVLAKPGTVMLPEEDFYIPIASDAFDGMRYFYENQGVMFDGQTWIKNTSDPYVYEEEDKPKVFRDLNVYYADREFYGQLLEDANERKGLIVSTQAIDDETPLSWIGTPTEPPGAEPFTIDFLFSWGSLQNTKIQGGEIIFDFKDAWSKYRIENQKWLTERGLNKSTIVLFEKTPIDPENHLEIVFDATFKDGHVTEYEQKITIDDEELINTFTVTVTAKGSQK